MPLRGADIRELSTTNSYTPAERFRFHQGTKEQNAWPDSEELDRQAFLGDLRRFVEESDLSIPRLAELLGVSGAILSMWIIGTAKPQPLKLLEVKRLLHDGVQMLDALDA
jgi:DNA-binding transcriptional regulator YiaG